jgi:hypothetical protein
MERLVSRSKKLLDEAPTMDFADFAPWALADGSIGYGSMDPDGSRWIQPEIGHFFWGKQWFWG